MKTIVIVLTVAARLTLAAPAHAEAAATATGTNIGQHIPPFTAAAITLAGDKQSTADFVSQKTKRVTAYIFVGTSCPATNAYADRFKQLAETYGPKGVDFVYIYPNNNDTSASKLAFHKEHALGGRLIDDQGATLAKLFAAQRTSELFVADKQGTVVYHGALDDSRDPATVKQHYLADALDAVLAGKPVTTATSQVFA